jgi:hypothetical protein
MHSKKVLISAVIFSGSIGLAANSVFAQAGSGAGGSAPGTAVPGQSAPIRPESGTMPRETQPTIPGQAAPHSPGKSDQVFPGQQGVPGVPGQDRIIPGQQGTIPERVERPGGVKPDHGIASASPDTVKKAKEALKAQGHNPGTIDGNMDSRTQQALRDFQQANKLPVTGVLDQPTAAKLGVTLNSGSSTPQKGQDRIAPHGSDSSIPGKRAVE